MSTIDRREAPLPTAVFLQGPDNWADWDRYISVLLLEKDDLWDIANGDYVRPAAGKDQEPDADRWDRDDLRAYGILSRFLSAPVYHKLPINLKDVRAHVRAKKDATSLSHRLWTHLESTYSAANGSRRAELLYSIWRTDLPEGADPAPHIASMTHL